jgi:outer membrane lipoprotein-sorting protein
MSGNAKVSRIACVLAFAAAWSTVPAQSTDATTLIRRIDAANHARYDHVLSYTVTEHYAVIRGDDQSHPAAEMTVLTTYKKGEGKTFEIKSQSGSELILRFGLRPLLDNEKALNNPATVESSWFSSANYDMKLNPGPPQRIGDRDCVALSITPRHKAPNMVEGTLWVDPRDGTIAQVEGTASKSPNPVAGTTHMMRQYTNIQGYSMATHARAESNSALIGRTVVLIDYSDYHLHAGT